MRVLITGSSGLIGGATVHYLREKGWDLRHIDIVEQDDAGYSICDITDFDAVREAVRGCEAIVHMAAIRNPLNHPGYEVYRVNTMGTFNIFEAAAQEGIKRVVQASSINALGCAWSLGDFNPQYFPVDEVHPSFTTDPYSFSKQQIEAMGAYFWRRDKISSTALRFPGVYRAEHYQSEAFYERRNRACEFIDHFSQVPETERLQQLELVRQHCIAFRAERNLEYPHNMWNHPSPDGVSDGLWQAFTFDRYNLWASLDVRDAVQSIEKSLTADFEGSHTLFITDSHNMLDYDSRKLVELFFPDVTQWKQDVTGSGSLFSIKKARELIGFEPQYSTNGHQS